MKEFFEKNKIFVAIIIATFIIGSLVYQNLQIEDLKTQVADLQEIIKENRGKNEQNKCQALSETIVTKVIDGDTVIVEGGHHVRLLGIDADERGYPCYEEAKSCLEEFVLNKKVKLEKDQTDVDQYKRCLRYIFLDGENINLRLVKAGVAICRFYEPDTKYREECATLEKEAIENKIGCKWGGETKCGKVSPPSPNGDRKWETLTPENTGLQVVPACSAGNYLGKEILVEGTVADTYRDLKSNTVFLNFEKAYPNHCFTAVIFSSDQYKFVEYSEKYYSNKIVRIRGIIKEYKGKPEIILKDPSQIEVCK